MAIGKYDSIYNKLKEDIEVIKVEQNYNNLSLAFSHWFLKNQYNLSEQEIAESIIDGSGDYGIDAVIHNDEDKSLEIFQFKFPSSRKTIKDEIKQADVYKLINGFNYLIDEDATLTLEKASTDFIRVHDELKESEIYNFKINFVSFNQGVIDNLEVISNFINKIKKEQGIEINYSDYNVQNVTNIYEKLQRQNSISIVLPYKHLQQSYSINEIDSYVGLINGKELIKSLEDVIGVIFDENIRLHEIKSKVNEGIKNTSSSDKDSSMFYFYNNGITFICDQVNLSPSNLTVRLDGASIVNGCQTVTSLYENHTKKELQEDVDLLVRITKISDYDERAKITQFLNSQNPIKESYFISNHTIVRDLQTKLFESNYYLERQINESSYKEQYVDSSIKNGKKIIKLDDVIQYYCGYHLDKFAATAKRNKNILFNNENIEEILSDITPDKVIESYETYLKVAEVITAYRRQRRNKENEEFAKLMGIDKKELDNSEEKYLFVNTADILILNTCKFLKLKDPSSDVEKNIVNAVKIIRDIIQNDQELKAMPPAGLTKNQLVYTKISEYMK
ncbi:hypothetical protein GUJ14_04255 [Enterococcus hirae]|uniref:AIPR family protein n=2 Tax=Enterococcus hirae TaxID=1354 RepID=UPI000B9FA220|nr:AIPR family protein [Enterococcus hirae]ASV80698.1 hypothetical protein A6J73_00330 [Enterococcus hirae]MDD9145578.1 AIPR family protein [Enterococcus hirae]MEB5735236.1 AIPR family protein [Enterococcus hirae]MEC4730968.1 AIPR family protein [Enterococcus hirae]NAA12216.1 hypothetical protein [Enterococcus hirae]